MSKHVRHSSAALRIGAATAILVIMAACAGQQGGTAAVGTTAGSTASASTVTRTVTEKAETVTRTVTSTVTSSSTRATSSDTPTGLAVGEGVVASTDDGAADITVIGVRRESAGGSEYADDPTNGSYLLVEVRYTCTEGEFTYNPFDWKIRDSAGHTYDQAYVSGYDDQSLDSGTIVSGTPASGFVVFDVPTEALTLEYTIGWGGAPATWNIPA